MVDREAVAGSAKSTKDGEGKGKNPSDCSPDSGGIKGLTRWNGKTTKRRINASSQRGEGYSFLILFREEHFFSR